MESKVALPTDNIYKFYALFGLFLLLACIYTFVNVHESYNKQAFERYVDLEVLNKIKELSSEQEARKYILETQKKIDAQDRKFFLEILGCSIGIAIFLMMYGFYYWHTKIQPQQDQAIQKQLEKIDLEIKALNKKIRPCK